MLFRAYSKLLSAYFTIKMHMNSVFNYNKRYILLVAVTFFNQVHDTILTFAS